MPSILSLVKRAAPKISLNIARWCQFLRQLLLFILNYRHMNEDTNFLSIFHIQDDCFALHLQPLPAIHTSNQFPHSTVRYPCARSGKWSDPTHQKWSKRLFDRGFKGHVLPHQIHPASPLQESPPSKPSKRLFNDGTSHSSSSRRSLCTSSSSNICYGIPHSSSYIYLLWYSFH